jgi:hypothetical protein
MNGILGAAASAPAANAGGRRGWWIGVAAVLVLGAAGLGAFLLAGDPAPEEGGPGTSGRTNEVAGSHADSDDPAVSGSVDTQPAASPDSEPPSSELAFELRESEARIAYLELASMVLDQAERSTRLREIAMRFDGTDTATRAAGEADELERSMGAANAEQAALIRMRKSVLDALREAAALGAEVPTPGEALARMQAVPDQAELEQDSEFMTTRATLIDAVLNESLAFGRASLERAAELSAAGDFSAMRLALTRFVQSVHLADYHPDETPPQVRDLLALQARAQESIAGIGELRERLQSEATRADLKAIAQGLGGPGKLHADLKRLDLDAASVRVQGAIDGLSTERARQPLENLLRQIDGARTVLTNFGEACGRSEWRRTTIYDPRDGRWSPIDAKGGDARGLFLDGANGAEHVPWTAWGGHTRELDKLLSKRMNREWTSLELEGIAFLLRASATVELLEIAAEIFEPASRGRLGENEVREIRRNFDVLDGWSLQGEPQALSAREEAAAECFVAACAAAGENAYTRAVGYLERLLDEYEDSLLVLLRSDGSSWREASTDPGAGVEQATDPDPTAPPPSPEEESETGSQDELEGGR